MTLDGGPLQRHGDYDYGLRVKAMKGLLKKLFGFLNSSSRRHAHGNELTEESAGRTCQWNKQLNDLEIRFLTLLEGKRANDPSVLGWWCAFNHVDGPKTIEKLCTGKYLTVADYRFRLRKATIPVLKAFLKKHGLSAKGNKADLVNRIVENVSESQCLEQFTQSYWAFTPKAVELIRAREIEAEEEHHKIIDLIRNGSYDAVRSKLYPNKSEYWGTEGTLCETIGFLMEHGFEGFGLREDIRRNMSSIVAAQAVDLSSRGHARCTQDISDYLKSVNLEFAALKLPESLMRYIKENSIDSSHDIYEIYIQFIIDRARAVAELKEFRELGIKNVRIDSVACRECGRSRTVRVYSINKAPLLPRSWNCQCSYESVL
jgi:hypothetical protein